MTARKPLVIVGGQIEQMQSGDTMSPGNIALADTHVLVGNSSNIATDVAMSGDATISDTGALTLANSGVTAGDYELTTLTVDAKGRLTAASNGTMNPTEFAYGDIPRGFTLTKQGATISPGGVGTWNESLVYSPNVFFDPKIGKYKMVYAGYTKVAGLPSVASLGYATSTDLVTWTQFGSNPFLSPSGSGADSASIVGPYCWYENGTYYLFYIGCTATGFEQGTKSICLATSTDFVTWTRHGAIITTQASTWRDSAVWHPNIVKRGRFYYLFFNATRSSDNTENIGYATATSLLGPWTVDDANSPLIAVTAAAWDSNACRDPYVYRIGDTWWMSYGGTNGSNISQNGLAYTSDTNFPLGWTKFASNPVLPNGAGGSIDSKTANAPCIWITASRYWLWYTADNGTGTILIALATYDAPGSVPHLTDGHIFVGNSAGIATDVAMSGDATISDTGAITVSKAGGNTIAEVLLATTSPTGTGTVSFTGIPATYTDLFIVVRGACAAAAAFEQINLTLNNDTGANYDYQTLLINNATPGSGGVVATNSIFAGWLPAASGVANAGGSILIEIPHYANTSFHKTVHTRTGLRTGTTTANMFETLNWGDWRSTAAVNRVDLIVASGNFSTGTVVSLYGRK